MGGLCLRLRQLDNTPEPSYALGSGMLSDIAAQLVDRDQPCMKEEVCHHDSLGQRISAAEVDYRPQRTRGR